MGPFDGDFWYFCYLFFGSFLLVAGVVGVFWCFLLILGQLGIFGVGIFVDWWPALVFSSIGGRRGYSHRSVAWVFSPDLDDIVDDELDEDSERISPDTPVLSSNPVIVYNIRKDKK
jgi:hypothetical protein